MADAPDRVTDYQSDMFVWSRLRVCRCDIGDAYQHQSLAQLFSQTLSQNLEWLVHRQQDDQMAD